MDLQSVLFVPFILASTVYYNVKLRLQHFTILQFPLNDEHVTLYVRHEREGGVTSNDWFQALLII